MSSPQQSSDYKRRSSGKRRRSTRVAGEAIAPEAVGASEAVASASAEANNGKAQASRAEAKARAASAAEEQPKSLSQRIVNTERFEGLRRFIRDTMSEIRKVIWPDRETARNLTLLVIAVSLVLGILLGGIDYVLFQLFEAMP